MFLASISLLDLRSSIVVEMEMLKKFQFQPKIDGFAHTMTIANG